MMEELKGKFIGTLREGKRVTFEGKVRLSDGTEVILGGFEGNNVTSLKEGCDTGYIVQRNDAMHNYTLCKVCNEKIGEFSKTIIDAICEVEV